MYDILWQSIQAGDYQLTDMLHRINVLYASGQLTDTERTELIAQARSNADASSEYSDDWRSLYEALATRMTAAESRLDALEADSSGGDDSTTNEYPDYVQPTGAHDAYYNGAKITYNGVRYICIAPEGTACVWTPDVYPAYWQEVTE